MDDKCDSKQAGEYEFRCYVQLAMMVTGGKWKQNILFALSRGEVVRFGVLRDAVFGITEKMLIQCLKELAKDGLVNRNVYRQVPPKVEYSLTDVGKSFIPILGGLNEWGKSYASYLVLEGSNKKTHKTGFILDNIDEALKVV